MNISLSAFAPENLVSRDGFGSPVPRTDIQSNAQHVRFVRIGNHNRLMPSLLKVVTNNLNRHRYPMYVYIHRHALYTPPSKGTSSTFHSLVILEPSRHIQPRLPQ